MVFPNVGNFKDAFFIWMKFEFEGNNKIFFEVCLAISSIIIPVLIYLTTKKKKAVLNPINNNSYSIITIQILHALTFTLIIQEIINLILIIISFVDYNNKELFTSSVFSLKLVKVLRGLN